MAFSNVDTSLIRTGRAKAFLSTFMAVERALVFIYTWFICVRRKLQLRTLCTAKVKIWKIIIIKNTGHLHAVLLQLPYCIHLKVHRMVCEREVKFVQASVSSVILALLTT